MFGNFRGCVGKGEIESIVTVTGIHLIHVVFDEKPEQCLRLAPFLYAL